MPAIPESILRKLYVPDSLKSSENGYVFEIKNFLAPIALTGLGITADDLPCDPGSVYLFLPEIGEIPAGGISGERPFFLPVNTNLRVRVNGAIPRQRLVIRADTREAGALQFGISLSPVQPKPKRKKVGLLKKINHRIQYANKVFRVQQDPQHSVYHYSPPANWMNDPNGLIYWKGNYHLFYQYNPFEAAWGNIHWGHAVSKDLLRWRHLPIALWPDPKGADADGCFSGCAVDNNGIPTLIYTGVYPETQCLASSPTDDLLLWKKRTKPVIPAPPQGMQLEGFRDPCVWQEGGEWRMVLGSGLTDVGGAVLLYRSKDLLEWHYMGILFNGHEKKPDPLYTGSMWECPSFFPLDDKWVLIVSIWSPQCGLYTLYYIGQYAVDHFIPDGPPHLLDGGANGCFYAPQTFLDKKGKRVMFGWLREARSAADQIKAGWSGAMSLPRYLSLSEKLELCSSPGSEIQTLRSGHEMLTKTWSLSDAVRGASMELLIRIPPDAEKWSGVHLTGGHGSDNNILIGVDNFNSAVVVDCRHAGGVISIVPVELPGMSELKLHVFVDGSIIEVYVEDQLPISARFYMPKPQTLRVRQVGEALVDLWKLKS